MIDIELDRVTHDIPAGVQFLGLVDGTAQSAQNVKQRLLHFTAEWFLDLGAGTPWIESILIKGVRESVVAAILKTRIKGASGIRTLTRFELAPGQAERGLSVTFSALAEGLEPVADTIVLGF